MIVAAGLGEQNLHDVVDVLVRIVEAAGAAVIFVGAAYAFGRFVLACVRDQGIEAFAVVRLDLGRFLALGLEFQLAADILRTAITPSFTQLAQLAAIATIRTALNFFLGREIKEQREIVQAQEAHLADARGVRTPPGGQPLNGVHADGSGASTSEAGNHVGSTGPGTSRPE
jgi:uncharacterized membrane protein